MKTTDYKTEARSIIVDGDALLSVYNLADEMLYKFEMKTLTKDDIFAIYGLLACELHYAGLVE